jgi:putative addiction module killer protein
VFVEVRQTDVYRQWFEALRDRRAALRIVARVQRLVDGNPGQYRMLKSGVGEMKVDYGPGIGFTSRSELACWSFSCVAATRRP